ncbi:hypothetical protein [Mesorhizobium sp. KR1-2]|uniref:hypothetical protein n=1 Tax=Mesorhizobium sp. KR1-2 TaxID=3156609 RepID=UPI0032B37AD6
MSAAALFELLEDFGRRPPRSGKAAPAGALGEMVTEFAESTPPPDPSELIAAEVERAEAALAERLANEHAAALEAERERHAAEVDALTKRLGEEAGATISARLAEMEARISELATTATARIVSGFLSAEVQKQSLESLARAIRAAVADAEAVRIRVSGPPALFEALCAAAPEHAANLDHVEATGFDLTVAIDEDIFETRISEWSAAISEILA